MDSKLTVHASSDVGLKRERNEDFHAVSVPDDPSEVERHGTLVVVADGMGGIGRGNVASRLAVESALQAYRSAASGDLLEDLRVSLDSANRAVHEEKVSRPELGAMGATCTMAAIRRDEVYLAHVGDTRAYLIRNGVPRQLTRDHSLVATLVERHELTPEEAKHDSRRNVVTRGLGVEERVEVDAFRLDEPLQPGDTVVLCTDGLHSQVSDAELAAIAGGRDLAGACKQLVDLANGRGGPDNITLILVRYGSAPDRTTATQTAKVEEGWEGEGWADPSATAVPAPRRGSRGGLLLLKLLLAFVALAVTLTLLWLVLGGMGETARKLEPGQGSASGAPRRHTA